MHKSLIGIYVREREREREREPFKHAHGTCDGNSFIMSNPSLYTQSTFVFIIWFFLFFFFSFFNIDGLDEEKNPKMSNMDYGHL